MNATTQLQDTLAQMAALQNQINAINDKASRASAVTSQAASVQQQADTLKQQRRGLQASLPDLRHAVLTAQANAAAYAAKVAS